MSRCSEGAEASPGARLRALLGNGVPPLVLPGAVNALAVRVIEEAGFPAAYVSGAGVTNNFLGIPDLGLLTITELTDHVAAMSDITKIPLLVDADTGFVNAINVQRTVRTLESAGAAGLQLEDQVTPKKCGHFAGKEVVDTSEMVGKIHAAVDARQDPNLVIVARTDARAVEGIQSACARAVAYHEAGADVLFVEAPRSVDEMRHITGSVPGVHIANMVEGGLTPLLTREELGELGFGIALYANAPMRGAVSGMKTILEHLVKHGSTHEVSDLMISWPERQELVHKSEYDEAERRYAGKGE